MHLHVVFSISLMIHYTHIGVYINSFNFESIPVQMPNSYVQYCMRTLTRYSRKKYMDQCVTK